MKKIIYIFGILIVALFLVVILYLSKKENVSQQITQEAHTDQQIIPSKKWGEYHNNKYGYSFSYPLEMKTLVQKSEQVSAHYFDDAPSQGFNITAIPTNKSILDYMAEMEGQPKYYVWEVEKTTEISGFSAVIAHQKTEEKTPINDFSSRSVFVKKNNILFQFQIDGGGDNIFNTSRFIESIKFDK